MTSAIKNIAVSGACKTAAIKPAIPTRVKLLSEIVESPVLFIILATTLPKILPINKVGAKIPPTPPAPKVKALAIILKKTKPVSKRITIQTLVKSKCIKLFFKASSGFPAIKLLITSKPSPYKGGIK